MFSYYTRGMNFYDMLLLKWKNINGNTLVYYRKKTKERFVISLNDYLKKLLRYFKNISNETGYVFPILLKDNLTPIQIENRKKKTLKKYKKDLKEIAELCNIDTILTSYVARHSFATNLKEKGISTDIISESQGHKNLAITQVYLKEFGSDIIDEAVRVLE